MNDNYLWDKSGNDPEIERLEDLLLGYRFEESEPPALPATNVVVFERPLPRWSFRMIIAASAGLGLLLVAGVWLRSGEILNEHSKVSVPEHSPAVMSAETLKPAVSTHIQPDPTVGSKVVTRAAKRSTNVQSRPRATQARTVRTKNVPPPALTAEEKHAYQQLMLALSITGSKLRMVREMIDGPENAQADDK